MVFVISEVTEGSCFGGTGNFLLIFLFFVAEEIRLGVAGLALEDGVLGVFG